MRVIIRANRANSLLQYATLSAVKILQRKYFHRAHCTSIEIENGLITGHKLYAYFKEELKGEYLNYGK